MSDDLRKPKLIEATIVIPVESLIAHTEKFPHDLAYKYESDLIANLARQVHEAGRRFTGWPDVFIERDNATFSNRIYASVWTVPR